MVNRQKTKTKKEEESYADMWDLYHTLSTYIATQLWRYLEATKRRYPSSPGASFRDWHLSEEEQEALIQEGLRLFCQHFRNLWL